VTTPNKHGGGCGGKPESSRHDMQRTLAVQVPILDRIKPNFGVFRRNPGPLRHRASFRSVSSGGRNRRFAWQQTLASGVGSMLGRWNAPCIDQDDRQATRTNANRSSVRSFASHSLVRSQSRDGGRVAIREPCQARRTWAIRTSRRIGAGWSRALDRVGTRGAYAPTHTLSFKKRRAALPMSLVRLGIH
jgi:hypothetical protein